MRQIFPRPAIFSRRRPPIGNYYPAGRMPVSAIIDKYLIISANISRPSVCRQPKTPFGTRFALKY
jgi:hypothetical protein